VPASLRIIVFFFAVLWAPLRAQYTINTIAGGGPANGSGALSVALTGPAGIARDAAGNYYIVSRRGHRVYKVDSNGLLSVLAGNGNPGYSGDGGAAVSASLKFPFGIAVDAAGNVYIADTQNFRVRKISNGIITTVA
jgi:hypothetical protein